MTEHKNWLIRIARTTDPEKKHLIGNYWKSPMGAGNTPNVEQAGRFSFDEAQKECISHGDKVEMVNYWAITDKPTTELAAGKIVRHHDEPQMEHWTNGQEHYGKPVTEQIADALAGKDNGWKTTLPLRDYTSAERKAMPVVTGVLHYFPDAIAAVSRVSKAGNDKHNPGEPLHWARGKSNDHIDSLGRHLLTPGAVDPDSGEDERAHRLWRDMADLQLSEEKRLVALGIRPLSGVIPDGDG